MAHDFDFDSSVLGTVLGGLSALDIPRLRIRNIEDAGHFLRGYGFDWFNEEDQERLWYFHRRALLLINEKIKFESEAIPSVIQERRKLKDLRHLLLFASDMSPANSELQIWSCAILRVMHVFVHMESDLFSAYSEDIQEQILAPFQAAVSNDPATGGIRLHSQGSEEIRLHRFDIKPFKTTSSSVIKLLAKSNIVAMRIFDKLGVRFITRSQFDSFRVIRSLTEQGILSFAHIVPDQSANTLYPVNLFLEVAAEAATSETPLQSSEIDEMMKSKLENSIHRAEYMKKLNLFTSEDYRFIKFICRKLIRIQPDGSSRAVSFFYPYEVQIVDYNSYLNHLTGESSHEAYKERQRLAARSRVLGESLERKDD